MAETTHLPHVNRVHFSAPFAWLLVGWRDMKRAPALFAAYGFALAMISVTITAILYLTGQFTWVLVLVGGFMIIAPVIATGIYRAAYILETGGHPKLRDLLSTVGEVRSDQIMLGVALFFLFGLWVEVAYLVYGLSTSAVHRSMLDFLAFMLTTSEGLQMALVGTMIGGVIAFIAYAIVVVSAPMLLFKDSDFFIASITSVRAVFLNCPAMILWALLIVIMTMIGIATGFLGLVIVFPWIGLSSWHAYRSLVAPPQTPVS
ncbi:MAG: DUF2189 domain-containing protein [Pseudomonadota bacterium]